MHCHYNNTRIGSDTNNVDSNDDYNIFLWKIVQYICKEIGGRAMQQSDGVICVLDCPCWNRRADAMLHLECPMATVCVESSIASLSGFMLVIQTQDHATKRKKEHYFHSLSVFFSKCLLIIIMFLFFFLVFFLLSALFFFCMVEITTLASAANNMPNSTATNNNNNNTLPEFDFDKENNNNYYFHDNYTNNNLTKNDPIITSLWREIFSPLYSYYFLYDANTTSCSSSSHQAHNNTK